MTAYVMPLSFCLSITAEYDREIFLDENGGEWVSFIQPQFKDPANPTYAEHRSLERFREDIDSFRHLDRTLTVSGDTSEERRADFLEKLADFKRCEAEAWSARRSASPAVKE